MSQFSSVYSHLKYERATRKLIRCCMRHTLEHMHRGVGRLSSCRVISTVIVTVAVRVIQLGDIPSLLPRG